MSFGPPPLSPAIRTLCLLVLVSIQQGCMPLVMHGPRVQEGLRGQLSAGALSGPDPGTEPDGLLPLLLGGFSRGWANENAAFSAGVQVPLVPHQEALLYGGAVDLYLQPSRARARGVGVLASWSFVMPYVQYGRLGEDGNGWYTTQGVAFTGREFREGMYWMPGIAMREQREDGSRAVLFHVSGGFGAGDVRPRWIAAAGVIVDFSLGSPP